jgi:hypothetical protein
MDTGQGARRMVHRRMARTHLHRRRTSVSAQIWLNPLSGSRNWRADGNGCDGLHLMQVSRQTQACNGLTVQGEHWRGSLSDRILIAENCCAALFVSTVSPDSEIRIGTAACASVGARYRFTRPGRGRGRPVVPVTGGRTWTQVRARALSKSHARVYKVPGLQVAVAVAVTIR